MSNRIGRRALLALAPALALGSGAAAAEGRTLKAVRDEAAGKTVIGEVRLDDSGRITVLNAAPGERAALADLARQMNAKPMLPVEAPAAAGAPRTTLASRPVRRGEPEFVPAMLAYIHRYYRIELRD